MLLTNVTPKNLTKKTTIETQAEMRYKQIPSPFYIAHWYHSVSFSVHGPRLKSSKAEEITLEM